MNGRPKELNPKTERIYLRLNKSDTEKINQMVKDSGSITLSSFMRECIFNEKKGMRKVIQMPSEVIQKLNEIGQKINQIAKAFNTLSNPHLTTQNKIQIEKSHNDIKEILSIIEKLKK